MSEHSDLSTSKQANFNDEESSEDEEAKSVVSPLLNDDKLEQEERRRTLFIDKQTRYISKHISRYESSFDGLAGFRSPKSFAMTSDKQHWTFLEWSHFLGLSVISQVVGVVMLLLCLVWVFAHRGGVAWVENPGKEFNWHPLLMTFGLIFFYGEAMITYRVLFFLPKKWVKLIHATLQILTIFLVSVALKAVFDSHNLPPKPIPNMYSLHSWLGITTVVLFGLQLLLGFAIFLWPGGQDWMRKSYMSQHVFWGIVIFALGVATAFTGLTEKAFFSIKPSYSLLPSEAYVLNFFGYSIFVFAVVVVFIATKAEWKRPPDVSIHSMEETR